VLAELGETDGNDCAGAVAAVATLWRWIPKDYGGWCLTQRRGRRSGLV